MEIFTYLFPNPPGADQFGKENAVSYQNKTPAFAGVTISIIVIIEPNTR